VHPQLAERRFLHSDDLEFRIDVFVRKRDAIVFGLFLFRDKQVVFRLQQVGTVIYRDLEIIAMRNGIFRARLDTKPAKDATAIIDIVDFGISFISTNTFGIRPRVVSRFDINTIRGTCGST